MRNFAIVKNKAKNYSLDRKKFFSRQEKNRQHLRLVEKYINPHTDFGFKRLFGSEFNKELKMYEDSVNAYRDIVNAIKQ